MIMSAAVLVGIVKAQTNTCAQNSMYECGQLAGFNGGMPFLFYCNIDNTVEVIKMCTCIECCHVINGGVGHSGSVHCT
ncbi:uncharacterized protein F5147DRAFT_694513 [Suillus discolor]|uniref:Uncharacterized protein n=1 Tax=Suillus discolor TaxID=1912936 RepID=A0A9P7F789_9AGAM|nr:uncharacterized protein F5147DRAFT_694513 [Suillus discolor]KAG2108702.1 hypothetical protein F5147DRAFT_694513 [Suillus discolor]